MSKLGKTFFVLEGAGFLLMDVVMIDRIGAVVLIGSSSSHASQRCRSGHNRNSTTTMVEMLKEPEHDGEPNWPSMDGR